MKKNKGITLVSLVVTIIVLLIIAGISIYTGKEMIEKASLEEIKTNMLLIEAKAKEYLEEANFKMGINPDDEKKAAVRKEIYEEKAGLQTTTEEFINSKNQLYALTKDTLVKWGLDKIELQGQEQYVIEFNDIIDDENKELSVEVYNTKGYNGNYSLTDIEKIEK